MAPVVVARLSLDRHRVLREHRGSGKKSAMVLAAVEAVANADAVWLSRGDNSDAAAQATAGDGRHRRSLVEAVRGLAAQARVVEHGGDQPVVSLGCQVAERVG